MIIALLTLEFLIGILLIGAILLHSAKGDGLGAIGGGATMFKSNLGMETGLNRVTGTLAVLFMVVAVVLGISS